MRSYPEQGVCHVKSLPLYEAVLLDSLSSYGDKLWIDLLAALYRLVTQTYVKVLHRRKEGMELNYSLFEPHKKE